MTPPLEEQLEGCGRDCFLFFNQYHPSLKTALVVENEFEKAITAIREGR